MIEKYEDFIGIYEDVYDSGFCEHMISEFERIESYKVGYNRRESENVGSHIKDDYAFNLNLLTHNLKDFNDNNVHSFFWNGLQTAFNLYKKQYSMIEHIPLDCSVAKVQKIGPGGGYHVWHSEKSGDIQCRDRYLVYILYLNTLQNEDGGETEFLYQRKRIQPKENSLLVFPSIFTHTHKGNLILSNVNKYIITGWFNLS